MFDNLVRDDGQTQTGTGANNMSGAYPSGLSPRPMKNEQVEDIFSGAEPREKPAIFQPRVPIPTASPYPLPDQAAVNGTHSNDNNKVMVLATMIGAGTLVLLAAFFAYRLFFASSVPEQQVAGGQQEEASLDPSGKEASSEQSVQSSLPVDTEQSQQAAALDSDGDGLTDGEEYRLGTNKEEADSDGDGLFDREEVKVYRTDPLNTDSDKDGYADGIEVKGGYNPNGQGQLFKQ